MKHKKTWMRPDNKKFSNLKDSHSIKDDTRIECICGEIFNLTEYEEHKEICEVTEKEIM